MCINNVWNKLEYAQSEDSVCSACMEAIGKMREENTLNPFEQFCVDAHSTKDSQMECLFLRMGYNDMLFEFMASDLSPLTICSLVTMCNKSSEE